MSPGIFRGRSYAHRGLVALLLVLAVAGTAFAQAGRGTISGVVIDPSGGVVPLANVKAANQETGVVTTTVTNDQGLYSLLNLPVGRYDVEFSKQGFQTFQQRGVVVGVASAITLDATLGVGGLTDAVVVTADAPILESRNAEIGTALKNDVVTDLPLNMTGGRQLENFAYAITPSVEGNNWESNIAGGAPFSKEVILDGTSAVIQIQGHISESSPPMEAVEEFKVQTSGVPAEYGRTGGGVFNFSLRSGTNDLKGSAYGQFRHEALNANTWMNNYLAAANPSKAADYEKARDRQKLGGASVGGPIFQNKTFYFASFEEYRQTRRQLGNFDRTVPVPAFLDGDFGQLLDRNTILGYDAGGNAIYKGAIFDPQTGLVFPDNRIPASRISPISQQIVDIYRDSYQPMIPGRLNNNSAATAYNDPDFTQHQFSVKGDHNFTVNSRLTGSLIWTKRPRTLTDQGGIWDPSEDMGGPLSRARKHEVTTYQARLSHSQVLSPTLLHVASATFNRFRNPSTTGSSGGGWPAALGLGVAGAYDSFPQINFGDSVNGVGTTEIGYGISNYYVTNVYQYNDSLSWVKGRHVFKFGGEARFIQMNSHGDRAFLEYNFSPTQTGVQGGPWANQVGFGFASFLLGDVASASQRVPSDLYGRRNYVALFAQDDFRVNDKLTVNLGLRWETTGGWREKYGRWANFNTSIVNPVTGARGGLEFADEVDGSFEGDRDWTEFGPRIGAAYQLTDRLVLRSAYGLFYTPIGTNYWGGVPYSFAPGFFGTNTVQQTGDGSAAFDWDQNPYPGSLQPAVKDPASTQWGLVSINPNSLKAGQVHQWNAGVDYELTSDIVVGANYLGNKGVDLQSGDLERNQPDPAVMKALMLAGKEWNWVSDEASAAAAGVPYPYPGFAGSAWMAITPYPQAAAGWGPLFFVGSPLGSTDYHALQLTINKRMSNGFATSAAYTLSRQRGNMDSSFQERWWVGPIQDVTKLDEEAKVIGDNDRTHILKGYLAWSLPFGNGRRFLSTAGGFKNALVSGWTISTIFRYESGLPLQMTSSNSYAGWHYPIYVNRTSEPLNTNFDGDGFDAGNQAAPGNRYFNPAAFANPAYGDLGKGPGKFKELRGFGGAYEDLGIIKDVRFGRYTAQVSFTLINVFNRHYFADPETNIASPYFGQVTGMGWQSPRQGQIGVRFEW
jgi:hypothetical protein